MAASKGDGMIAVRSHDLHRLVIAMLEYVSEFGAQFQEMAGPGQLDMAVRPMPREVLPIRRVPSTPVPPRARQNPPAAGYRDRPATDPKLGARVKVRHAGIVAFSVTWLSEFNAPNNATLRASFSSELTNSPEIERSRIRSMKACTPAS